MEFFEDEKSKKPLKKYILLLLHYYKDFTPL